MRAHGGYPGGYPSLSEYRYDKHRKKRARRNARLEAELERVAYELAKSQERCPSEIVEIVDKRFWDLF
jgi:hypothetical protein